MKRSTPHLPTPPPSGTIRPRLRNSRACATRPPRRLRERKTNGSTRRRCWKTRNNDRSDTHTPIIAEKHTIYIIYINIVINNKNKINRKTSLFMHYMHREKYSPIDTT
ncbi:hypothetical protein CHELA20_51119 [Hyphomicrobiales bacterium]|nr:hypothetical protein CHELA20_51119 [Hyphomicrobiales bacterium]CAH1673930.1 hypothetical protein CHELA41_23893 [Hyphomicrobiales bacterium]